MDYSMVPLNYLAAGNGNRCPDEFILSYRSYPIPNDAYQFVSCKFSLHPNHESICAFGSENGKIVICDAMAPCTDFIKTRFGVANSVVFDLCYIPTQPNLLVSLSGASRLELWDIERATSTLLIGHKDSVRCASIWPENPFCLLTGSRDGAIMAWDLREKPIKRKIARKGIVDSISHVREYLMAHDASVPITSILHLSENYFISSSTLASSGIRIWDFRYQIASSPIQTLFVPQMMSKASGIASMCWDRYRSSFFAACTDNAIYEYVPSVNREFPVRTLRARNINSFFVQCSASPISDHLLCGSSHAKAFIWDLQENRHYMQHTFSDYKSSLDKKSTYLPNSKFVFEGHNKEVECVQWSSQGNFMTTMDSECLRIWSFYPPVIQSDLDCGLTYPTWNTFDEEESNSTQTFSQKSLRDGDLHASDDRDIAILSSPSRFPFTALNNLPSLYIIDNTDIQLHQKKTKREIVIKSNLNVTPAFKISRSEGHDNFTPKQQKTPKMRRNLTTEFKNLCGSGTKRKFDDTTSPLSLSRPSSRTSSRGGSAKKKNTKGMEDNEFDRSAVKSPNILNYFSRVPVSSPPSYQSQ